MAEKATMKVDMDGAHVDSRRALFEGLVSTLGVPRPLRIAGVSPLTLAGWRSGDVPAPTEVPTYVHPVFPFAHHFRSYDSYEEGYTANRFRGDHQTIPFTVEVAPIFGALDVSFHKGEMFVTAMYWPRLRSTEINYDAALSLLNESETR